LNTLLKNFQKLLLEVLNLEKIFSRSFFASSVISAFGFISSAAASAPAHIDYLSCGEIACAYFYQGEGVNHLQLIMHVWPKGGGLNSDDVTIILDFPNDPNGTSSIYIGNTLVEYYGPGVDLSMPEQHGDKIFDMGIYLAEGLQIALNNPETADFGWWPSQSIINELVEQSADQIPQQFSAWDDTNPPFPPDENGTGGGHSENAVGGLLGEELCVGFECFDTEDDQNLSLAAQVRPQQRADALRERTAPLLLPGNQRSAGNVNRLRAQQNSVASEGTCGGIALANAVAQQGLEGCYDKCDTCIEQNVATAQAIQNANAELHCMKFASSSVLLSAVATEAIALLGAATIYTELHEYCMKNAITSLAGFKATQRLQCRSTCRYLFELSQ